MGPVPGASPGRVFGPAKCEGLTRPCPPGKWPCRVAGDLHHAFEKIGCPSAPWQRQEAARAAHDKVAQATRAT
eukprot:6375266-Pyramimonas_sp.AAC.1